MCRGDWLVWLHSAGGGCGCHDTAPPTSVCVLQCLLLQVVLTGLPMLLVRDEREWHQFESDLSFNGIVEFVQKTLKCVSGACRGVSGM